MNFIKFVRIFLLILIVMGIGLLATQKIWVPKVVNIILGTEVAEKKEQKDLTTYETNSFSFKYDSSVKVTKLEEAGPTGNDPYADYFGLGNLEGLNYPVEVQYYKNVSCKSGDEKLDGDISNGIVNIQAEGEEAFGANTFDVSVDTTQKSRFFDLCKNDVSITISIPDTEKTPRYIDMSSIIFK